MMRRAFLAISAAATAASLWGGPARVEPILRFGVMSDTHVGETDESFVRVRQALALFREKKCRLVVNAGDIADRFSARAYATYRRVVEETFAGAERPEELFAYAWHDAVAWNGTPRRDAERVADAAFRDVRTALGAPNAPVDERVIGGVPFLVFPQFIGPGGLISYADYDRRIAAACAAHPGKPVFVVDHVPPSGTVCNSVRWGDPGRGEILRKHPQAVCLTGHVHGSLRSDLLVWQKEYTVINAGCLQSWDGLTSGCAEERHPAYGVLTVDVFADRLEVRRWDVRDGSEIRPDARWILPWPFAAATAPFDWDRRKAQERPAAFPSDAQVLARSGDGLRPDLTVQFPEAAADVIKYRIDVAERKGGRWEPAFWTETLSEFWRHPRDRTGRTATTLPALCLTPGSDIRVSVTPIGQYGTAGVALSAEARVSKAAGLPKPVFASENPMRELSFVRGFAPEDREEKPCRPDADGFFGPIGPKGARLRLPKGVFAGNPRERFDVLVGLRTIQSADNPSLALTLAAGDTSDRMCGRHPMPPGDSGTQRYVITGWQPPTWTASEWDLGFEWGAEARVRVDFVRVYRTDGPRDASADVRIVGPESAKPWETTAAEELRSHLKRIVPSGRIRVGGSDAVTFHVGDTAFARTKGLSASAFKDEQWTIASFGGDVVLNGGGSRGCLYAVSHFLEDFCDVRWWGDGDEDVPVRDPLDLPELKAGGRPHFLFRQIYTGKTGHRTELRHRLNGFGSPSVPAELGGCVAFGPPKQCHTWNHYLPFEKYGKEHPEWYSLRDGVRVGGQTRGQLCLTCPGLADRFLPEVESAIARGERAARERGVDAPVFYDISMNDNYGFCLCDPCAAETKAYGHSGRQLRFVNALARELGRRHPGLLFTTFAYMFSEPVPTGGVRAEDNVAVRLCNTRQNIAAGMEEDASATMRRLTEEWNRYAKNLFVWEYAITFDKSARGLPVPSEFNLGAKYRFYSEHGVKGIFIEQEDVEKGDLHEMKYYLMSHLMEDPTRDADRLAVDFLRRYYGKEPGRIICRARKYLDRIRRERGGFLPMYAKPGDFNFIREADIAKLDALWDEAETAAKGDAKRLRRVRSARQSLVRLKELRVRNAFTRKESEPGVSDRPFFSFPATNALYSIRSSHGARWTDDPEASTGHAIGMPFTNKGYRFPVSVFFIDSNGGKHIAKKTIKAPSGTGYSWYDLGQVTVPASFSICFTGTGDAAVSPGNPELVGRTCGVKARLRATSEEFFIDRVVLIPVDGEERKGGK